MLRLYFIVYPSSRHNTDTFSITKKDNMKFTSSSIDLLTVCISWCCHNRVLNWVYTDPYCFIYWAILENIPQLPIQYGESTLPILSYQEGHTGSIIFRNWECLYYDSSRDIRWNIAWALGKGLRLYFTVYLSSRHNTDTILPCHAEKKTSITELFRNKTFGFRRVWR